MSLSKQEKEDRELAILLEYDDWAKNPWHFIRDCLWTIDEADKKEKKFPDKPYLEYMVKVWMREPLLAVPKSRRMMATWLFLGLHLWAALFNPHSAVFVQSKKEQDSAFLIGPERMEFMYRRLLKDFPQHTWPTVTTKLGPPLMKFNNGSWVMGIGQGADQLRQYTASYVMLDEVAFWAYARATWGSLKPIMEGGGRITAISSMDAGFFADLVEGKL